jgi:predicted negative regulator of RcsB-dependent stress response
MDNNSTEPTLGIQLQTWVEVNKKKLIIGVLGVGVAIFLGVMLYNYQAEKEARASQALSDIKLPASPMQPVPPGTADQLLKFADEYRGSKAAPRALLMSASLAFTEGNYAEAEKRFARVAQEYPSSLWLSEAAYGVAASLDAGGKTNEAIAKYEEIRKRYASSPVIDQTKLALARLYEKSKPEEAFRLYDEIMKANPAQYSGIGNEAGMNLEDLLKQHPELAKLREPAIPPQMQPQTMSITNRTVVSNTPLMLNTNLLRQTMSNAAVRLTNTVRAATNAVATNVQKLLTTPPPTKPAAPAK